MTVSWDTASKSAREVAGLANIDSQTAPAFMELGTSGMATVLAVLTLQKPSFTENGAGVLTLAGVPISATANSSGTAAAARIKDGAGTIRVSGLTVGTGSSDINLNSTAITSGQTVTLSSFTITHSP